MLGKGILWISALLFTGYGMVSFFAPGIPTDFAGLAIMNGDGRAEIGAMYGGLQTGIGLFCLLAALNTNYFRAGLILLVLGIGALALGRLYSAVVTTDPLTAYTYGALIYEITTAALAALALMNLQRE